MQGYWRSPSSGTRRRSCRSRRRPCRSTCASSASRRADHVRHTQAAVAAEAVGRVIEHDAVPPCGVKSSQASSRPHDLNKLWPGSVAPRFNRSFPSTAPRWRGRPFALWAQRSLVASLFESPFLKAADIRPIGANVLLQSEGASQPWLASIRARRRHANRTAPHRADRLIGPHRHRHNG